MPEKHLHENKENIQMYAIMKWNVVQIMMALRLMLKK